LAELERMMNFMKNTDSNTNTDAQTNEQASDYTNFEGEEMKRNINIEEFLNKEENKAKLEEFVGEAILKKKVKINKITYDKKYGILDLDAEYESGEEIKVLMYYEG
jgi:hypothetical protein